MNKPNSLRVAGVTKDLFLEWRAPRFGTSNPTRMNNAVWEWLIRSRISAYQADREFNRPSIMGGGPTWCFDRFGQSSTELTDGRTVLIGGEHEDYYDPDFCIYNDVVVLAPDDSVDIHGYPDTVFPVTDFHSATLIDDQILIVGNLGYENQRMPGHTPVYVLNMENFGISAIETTGDSPGWIHKHTAVVIEDGRALRIEGGKIDSGEGLSLLENIDGWRLDLGDWSWSRLTKNPWERWEVKRVDRKTNHLWETRQAQWSREYGWEKERKEGVDKLTRELGGAPDLDLITRLYRPEIAHEEIPENEEEYGTHRISIDGVVVRYVEESSYVQMTVEGDLPRETVEALKKDLLEKFSLLENTPSDLEAIPG